MSCFLLRCNEDGTTVEMIDEATLTDRLNTGYYGSEALRWASGIPDLDPNYWRGQSVLIKGELVQPKPRETVTKWEVP